MAVITPCVSLSAVSTESVNRRRTSGLMTSRSMTISTLCLRFLSSEIFSRSSRMTPSTRTRAYPSLMAWSKSFLVFPFSPAHHGREDLPSFVPSGSVMDLIQRSCSADCGEIAFPQFGQWGAPIRAYSNRR